MPLAETLIAAVAPAIAKVVLKFWAGDQKLATQGGSTAIDVLTKAIPDLRARNEVHRQLDAIGEKAAASLQFIFDTEGKSIFAEDQETVARLVADTLDSSRISMDVLVGNDLDPARLSEYFVANAHERLAGLPQSRAELFRRVIQEASQSIIDLAHELPNFGERTFGELLRGNRVLIEAANRTLEGLERIRSQVPMGEEAEGARFETEYRRAVARSLNRMEIFGVDLAPTSRSHPLSVAYVSLEVGHSAQNPDEEADSIFHSVELALAGARRILIKGPAGAGKTTLVRWIAVQAATRSFEGPLIDWNDTVPFVIRLRQFSGTSFPAPEAFPALVARAIAGTMPQGWVHEKLRSGHAVVMVDGVDEVAEARRDEVRAWIKELTYSFPEVRLIVTSRQFAVKEGWLTGDGFAEADLQPMDTSSIEKFIDHWHRAVAEEVQQEQQSAEFTTLAASLKDTLRRDRAIRRLATSPLLCGVICALHRDTNKQLPKDRLDLYGRCCWMLLERRDPESGMALTDYPRLNYRQKTALLNDLAYWMLKNEWTEVSVDGALSHLGAKLQNLRTETGDGPAITATNVLKLFLERSGMLRQPMEGKLDFAHRTFQEFMGAQAAVDEGDTGVLVNNATNPQWREVIVLAAGLARPRERNDLITDLIAKGDANVQVRYQLHLLAAACLDTAVDLDPAVKKEVASRVAKLVPPSRMQDAAPLADAAGEIAVPFLKRHSSLTAPSAAACVRALGLIGSFDALQVIADYAHDYRMPVLREVIRCADRFDLSLYAQLVVPHLDAKNLPGDALVSALLLFGAQSIKGLDTVRYLNFTNSRINDLSPLRNVPNIEHLDLWYKQVSDLSPLQHLTRLKRLSLGFTKVNDISPLQGLAGLQVLRLSRTEVSDLFPLRAVAELQDLDLFFTNVSDISPLEGLTNLHTLNLSHTKVSDISPLRGLTKLRTLDLSHTKVSEVSALYGLTNLNSLRLAGLQVTDDQLELLAVAQTGLEILRVYTE